MSTAFTHPPHPSKLLLQPATRPYPVVTTSKKCSPHDVLNFDSESLRECSPVLYLPPLLSSLPENIDFQPQESLADPELPPLATATCPPNIDPASLSLHKALHHFRPLSTDYAITPYPEAFNWEELLLPKMDNRDWYCVAFRSKRKAGSNGDSLYAADKLAHEEAIRNGGLIMYWYGIPHPETGMNLATCIWQSREHAIAASSQPYHLQAMRLAAESYEVYELERYRLLKQKGDSHVTVEMYTGGQVGW